MKIVNRDNVARNFRLDIDGPDAMIVSAVGEQFSGSERIVTAGGDGVRSLRLFITLPAGTVAAPSIPIVISVADVDTGETAVNPTVFLSGG